MEKLQSWAPRFIVVSVEIRKLAFAEVKFKIIVVILTLPEENQFACTVDQQLDVVVALNHLQML